jgi:hypothetical protein
MQLLAHGVCFCICSFKDPIFKNPTTKGSIFFG